MEFTARGCCLRATFPGRPTNRPYPNLNQAGRLQHAWPAHNNYCYITMKQKPHALAGLAAPVLFAGTYLLLTASIPGFDHFTQTISAIGAQGAPYAWAWNLLGYVGTGFLISFFAIGLHRAVATEDRNPLSFLGLFLSGIFLVVAGIFPVDSANPNAMSGTLHTLGTTGSFIAFVLAAFTYPALFRNHPFWNRTIIPSLVLAWSCILSVFLRLGQAPGIGQRAGIVFYLLWIVYLAIHLYRFDQIQNT